MKKKKTKKKKLVKFYWPLLEPAVLDKKGIYKIAVEVELDQDGISYDDNEREIYIVLPVSEKDAKRYNDTLYRSGIENTEIRRNIARKYLRKYGYSVKNDC